MPVAPEHSTQRWPGEAKTAGALRETTAARGLATIPPSTVSGPDWWEGCWAGRSGTAVGDQQDTNVRRGAASTEVCT